MIRRLRAPVQHPNNIITQESNDFSPLPTIRYTDKRPWNWYAEDFVTRNLELRARTLANVAFVSRISSFGRVLTSDVPSNGAARLG
jgi:hypothetical protein